MATPQSCPRAPPRRPTTVPPHRWRAPRRGPRAPPEQYPSTATPIAPSPTHPPHIPLPPPSQPGTKDSTTYPPNQLGGGAQLHGKATFIQGMDTHPSILWAGVHPPSPKGQMEGHDPRRVGLNLRKNINQEMSRATTRSG